MAKGRRSRRLLALDLFAGCGGLSLGLRRAGFQVIAAVEFDRLAIETYSKNHPTTRLFATDIRRLAPEKVLSEHNLKPGDLDLLAGCPPCQGFSNIRTRNGRRSHFDARNTLLSDFGRFAAAIQPRAILMENVPGLLRHHLFKTFVKSLKTMGYGCSFEVLDASDFGLPQRRRRLVLFAAKECSIAPPAPVRYRATVRQAIGGIRAPGYGTDPLHDYSEKRSSKIKRLITRIPRDGGSRRALGAAYELACHRRIDGFYDVYGRMSWSQPSPTITCGCINPSKGRYLHPEQHRAITLREAAMLQGFPRNYFFSLNEGRYRTAELIGNAFPPPFATVQAFHIAEQLARVERTA